MDEIQELVRLFLFLLSPIHNTSCLLVKTMGFGTNCPNIEDNFSHPFLLNMRGQLIPVCDWQNEAGSIPGGSPI